MKPVATFAVGIFAYFTFAIDPLTGITHGLIHVGFKDS